MSPERLAEDYLDATLSELHTMWCEEPDASHDGADAEAAARALCLAIWELMHRGSANPQGLEARAVELMAIELVRQQLPPASTTEGST